MFFGRNEEEGLRCVYHGWKFDVSGACVDMPSEPAESNFKNKVRTQGLPDARARRRHLGLHGPARGATAAARPRGQHAAATATAACTSIMLECNWMQGWEGEMDTVHAAFLHGGATRSKTRCPAPSPTTRRSHRDAMFSVIDTDWGTSYGVRRPAEEDTYYWRIAHQLFPFYAMVPTGVLGPESASAPTCRWTTTTRWSGR